MVVQRKSLPAIVSDREDNPIWIFLLIGWLQAFLDCNWVLKTFRRILILVKLAPCNFLLFSLFASLITGFNFIVYHVIKTLKSKEFILIGFFGFENQSQLQHFYGKKSHISLSVKRRFLTPIITIKYERKQILING